MDVDDGLRGAAYLLLLEARPSTHGLFVTHPAVHSLAEIWQPSTLLEPKRGHHVARIRDWTAVSSQALLLPATPRVTLAV